MNKVLGILFLMSLVACSKSGPEAPSPEESSDFISLEAKDMTISGDLLIGNFQSTDGAKLVTYSIKNTGTEPLTGPVTLSDATNFTLAYQNCTKLAVKSSCSVKISFDPKNKSGNYASTLTFDTVTAQITASVTAPPPPTASVQFLMSSTDISSSGLVFEQISDKQNLLKTISIKNNSSVSVNSQSVTIQSSLAINPFSIAYDNCSNLELKPTKSCTLKINLSGKDQSGAISGSLLFNNQTLALTGDVLGPQGSGGSGGGENIVFIVNNSQLSEPLSQDLGSFTGTQSTQLIINAKNIGSVASAISTANLSNANFSLPYNQCVSKSLAPGATCQMRIYFSASGKSPLVYSAALNFANKVINVSATIPGAPTCAPDFHLEANVCTENLQSCPIDNGTGSKVWMGTMYSPCTAQSCIASYHVESGSCQANVKSCPIQFGVGSQSWISQSNSYSSCQVVSCQSNYIIDGSSCILDVPVTAQLLKNINTGTLDGVTQQQVMELNGIAIFMGNDGSATYLYRIDASGAAKISNTSLATGANPSQLSQMIKKNNKIYYLNNGKLYSTDGYSIVLVSNDYLASSFNDSYQAIKFSSDETILMMSRVEPRYEEFFNEDSGQVIYTYLDSTIKVFAMDLNNPGPLVQVASYTGMLGEYSDYRLTSIDKVGNKYYATYFIQNWMENTYLAKAFAFENGSGTDITQSIFGTPDYDAQSSDLSGVVKLGGKVFLLTSEYMNQSAYLYEINQANNQLAQVIQLLEPGYFNNGLSLGYSAIMFNGMLAYRTFDQNTYSDVLKGFDGTSFHNIISTNQDEGILQITPTKNGELIYVTSSYNYETNESSKNIYYTTNGGTNSVALLSGITDNSIPMGGSYGALVDTRNMGVIFDNKVIMTFGDFSSTPVHYYVIDSNSIQPLKTFRSSYQSDVIANGDGMALVSGLNKVAILANDASYGSEIFLTNGQVGNAVISIDTNTKEQGIFNMGPSIYGDNLQSYSVRSYFKPQELNGSIIFAASSADYGVELWKTDGTVAGTTLLKDMNPGLGSSFPIGGFIHNNVMYFSATDGLTGEELWRTDGTASGTYRLADLSVGPMHAILPQNRSINMEELNGEIYFVARGAQGSYRVHKYNISSGLVSEVLGNGITVNGMPSGGMVKVNGKLIMSQSVNGKGNELVVINGNGTIDVIKDINPGNAEGVSQTVGIQCPINCIVKNNKLYFNGIDSGSGADLWVTDGTEAGTVKLINSSSTSSQVASYFADIGSAIIVPIQMGGSIGDALYKIEGPQDTVSLVKEFNAGSANDSIFSMQVINNKAYFLVQTPSTGREIGYSDGTTAGSGIIDLVPGSQGLGVQGLYIGPANNNSLGKYKNRLVLTHSVSPTGSEFYFYDPINNKFEIMGDIIPGNNFQSSDAGILGVINNKLIFIQNHPQFGFEPYSFEK